MARVESLEPRHLLSGDNAFAEVQGTILVSDTAPVFQFSLENPTFTLTSGATILSFQVDPIAGSTLDPAPVIIRDDQGQEIAAIRTNDDVSSGIGSMGVFSLGLGDYTVHVPGEEGSTGGFDLIVSLVGDVDGDGDVEEDDRAQVSNLRKNGPYQLEADADLDGRLTAFDYTMARRNVGDSTTLAFVNQSPTADNDSFSTDTMNTLFIPADGVLVNDSDPDFFDSVSVSSFDGTSTMGAAVSLQPDGSFTYDPVVSSTLFGLSAGAEVTDTFDYTISDLQGATSTATITVMFTRPLVIDDLYSTDEATVLILDAASGLLSSDDSSVTAVTAFDAVSVMGANVSVGADGSFTYDPTVSATLEALKLGETAIDTFTYTVDSGAATATVSIVVVGLQDDPDDIGATDEDTLLNVVAASGLLVNDPGVSPTVTAFDALSALGATVSVNVDGSYTYDPTAVDEIQVLAAGETVFDSFAYTSFDGSTTTDAVVTITLTGVNDAPVAVEDFGETDQETILVGESVLANDYDVDNDDTFMLTEFHANQP